MSNANFNVDTILKLVDLGLRVGTVLVERHSNQPISTMSDAEILAAIDKINIHTDSAIEAGEQKAAARKRSDVKPSHEFVTGLQTMTSPAAILPSTSRDDSSTDSDTGDDTSNDTSDFEDEGDDQGHPV